MVKKTTIFTGTRRVEPREGVREDLSCMPGNCHVQFWGGGEAAMPPRYPTDPVGELIWTLLEAEFRPPPGSLTRPDFGTSAAYRNSPTVSIATHAPNEVILSHRSQEHPKGLAYVSARIIVIPPFPGSYA